MRFIALLLLVAVALEGVTCATLHLSVKYPKQKFSRPNNSEIYLRGDALGLNWNKGVLVPFLGNDLWQTNLTFAAAAYNTRFEFKVLVNDETWQIGANEIMILPSGDCKLTIYPWFYTFAGEYKVTHDIKPPADIKLLPRPCAIYTPGSYLENTYRTVQDVLIMHDGENVFNDSTSFLGVSWRADDTVNHLVFEGKMREIIIVAVYNTVDRIYEYTYSADPDYGGGGGDVYLDYLEASIIPYTDDHYRALTNQENLGILGSSLGGLISCYAGWTRASVYSRAGCMSSSFWWNDEDFNNVILNNYPAPSTKTYEVYLDSGDCCIGSGHDDKDQTIRVRDHINALGFTLDKNEFYYLDKGGSHSEVSWGDRFYVPMEDLYPPIPHRDVELM